jgi:3-isopropylmalate/(R)-2-methylmalate dehydratase large subunit
VPEVIKVELSGKPGPAVMAKDIALLLLQKLGTRFALYKTLEFSGAVIEKMATPERMVLCNMAVEMGAKSSYIAPDKETASYLKEKSGKSMTEKSFSTDEGFEYAKTYTFDLSDMEPLVACPHNVDNVHPLSGIDRTPINQAFIGSCIGGRLEDLAIAADELRGKKIASGVRLIVTPSSTREMQAAMEKGYIADLLAAGATITTPGCGACCGVHLGLIGEGEVGVTASARNFPGRMGSSKSMLYVASVRTVARAAISGHLGDKE